MRRVAIVLVSVLLVLVVALGAALVMWQVRSLTSPQAEYLVKSELVNAGGFGGVYIEHVASRWDTARARATLIFGIRSYKTARVAAAIDFVRVDGSWRVLRVQANGQMYASLVDLSNEQMAELRVEHARHVAEMTVRAGQAAGDAAIEIGRQMGNTITDRLRKMTQ